MIYHTYMLNCGAYTRVRRFAELHHVYQCQHVGLCTVHVLCTIVCTVCLARVDNNKSKHKPGTCIGTQRPFASHIVASARARSHALLNGQHFTAAVVRASAWLQWSCKFAIALVLTGCDAAVVQVFWASYLSAMASKKDEPVDQVKYDQAYAHKEL